MVAFDDGGVRAQQAAQLPIQAACDSSSCTTCKTVRACGLFDEGGVVGGPFYRYRTDKDNEAAITSLNKAIDGVIRY